MIKRYEQDYDGALIEVEKGALMKYDEHAAEVARLKNENLIAEQCMREAGIACLMANEKFKAQDAEINALREQVRGMAAEGANMRNAIGQTIGWQQSVDEENTESVRMLLELETQATDATLLEVGARAAEGATEQVKQLTDVTHCVYCLEGYAEDIRSGEVQP